MIEDKVLPTEFVSIRQVWIRQIHRCTEAMSNRYRTDVTQRGGYMDVPDVGESTVVESVLALYYSLVDYGQAVIKTEATKYFESMVEDKEKYKNNKLLHFKHFFEYIIELLNKYDMLFETKPEGYSNTRMRSVKMEENNAS